MSKKILSAEKIKVYCDGGARNNPGPAAIGVVIEISKSEIKEYSEFLGSATNNQAEYQAVIFALKKIKQLIGKEKSQALEVEIRSDSELLIKQLNGQFKIKDKDLQPLFFEIWNTKQDFKDVKFIQVPREENKEADLLVNKELNNREGMF
jgi:ribonuclease HI